MAVSQDTQDLRLARILLPATVLREVDELLLQGRGGYRTRQEFFHDAVQNHLLEVKFGTSENRQLQIWTDLRHPSPTPDTSRPGVDAKSTLGLPESNGDADRAGTPLPEALASSTPVILKNISETVLKVPARGRVIRDGLARVRREPLFGLHNRDFPSIWSAWLLAELTREALVPFQEFLEEATRRAWRYARSLLDLEKQLQLKLTALYPTNTDKPQSAEEGFRAFAIGVTARRPNEDGTIDASGPLFSWGVCQLARDNGRLTVGLTDAGYELIKGLDGIALTLPHEQKEAERFLGYLRQYAPWDWSGFERVLDAVAERSNRSELAQYFHRWRPDWSEAMASTNAAGYVARAREWGLLQPKLVDSRYALTEFGEQLRAERSVT